MGTWPIATATFDGLTRPHTVLVFGTEIHKTPNMFLIDAFIQDTS